MKRYFFRLFATVLVLLTLDACKEKDTPLDTTIDESQGNNFAIPDWTEATHGKSTDPNYDVVFSQNAVNTIEISISKEDWVKIKDDMKVRSGNAFGAGGTTMGGAPGGAAGGANDLVSGDPIYVPVKYKFNNKSWYRVGFRLKGNSSLSQAWRAGNYKLPFRLKFDEYEDTYPQIEDQRFYGFQELSMSPNFNDASLMREKVAADVFREAGIPAAQTSFYKIYIDFGEGLKYCGVYTMVEVVDDSMVKTQFGEKKGNVYKPEGTGATFVEGGFNQSHFEKKNNEDAADWSDIKAVFDALHSKDRTSNATQWRTNLEKVFNVDHFLKWLAVNTTMQNWDTYGAMSHNYYLYNSPTKKITWIPWDNNEALKSQTKALTLGMTEVKSSWPLIRYLIDDPTYLVKYKGFVKTFKETIFTTQRMNEKFDRFSALISPAAAAEQTGYTYLKSATDFTNGITAIKDQVVTRNKAAEDFLK